jgi:hypothetical protein
VVASVGTRYSSAYAVTVFGDTGSYWLKLWTPRRPTQASLTYNAPTTPGILGLHQEHREQRFAGDRQRHQR